MIRRVLRAGFERFPGAALLYRGVRDMLDQRRPAQETPWGFTLAGHTEMARGDFEPEETRVVRELLGGVDLLVNVGANIGYYCCHALSMGKPVVAIEPIARNLYYLLRNIRVNGWARRAHVVPVAVGARTDIVRIWGGDTGASLVKGWAAIPPGYVTYVPMLTLDWILGERLRGTRALILADIEGAEHMMLQGAAGVLRNDPKPIWMLEVSTTQNQPSGVGLNPHFASTFGTFFAAGYRAFTAEAHAMELTEALVGQVARGEHPLKTHNFVFRPV